MLQRLLTSFLLFLTGAACCDPAPLSIEAMRAERHTLRRRSLRAVHPLLAQLGDLRSFRMSSMASRRKQGSVALRLWVFTDLPLSLFVMGYFVGRNGGVMLVVVHVVKKMANSEYKAGTQ